VPPRQLRSTIARSLAAGLAAAAAIFFGLTAVAARPAIADDAGGVFKISVTSATGVAPQPPPIPLSAIDDPQNQDVAQQLTTVRTNAGPQPPPPYHVAFVVKQELFVRGMSFAQLAKLSGLAPRTLIAGPNAVTVATGGGGPGSTGR
jgi:hypothetical protein